MSLIKVIVGKEANIKNKVRAGREKSLRMIHSLRQNERSPKRASFVLTERVGLNMKYFCKFNFFHINFEEKE